MNTRFFRSSFLAAVLGEWLVLLSAVVREHRIRGQLASVAGSDGGRCQPRNGLAAGLERAGGSRLEMPVASLGRQHAGHLGRRHLPDEPRRRATTPAAENRRQNGPHCLDARGGYGFDAATRGSLQIKQQSRPAQVPRYAQSGHPVSGDGRPLGRRPLRQRRPGRLRLRRSAPVEAKSAGRFWEVHDLVGTRQQSGDPRGPGDLGLHAGFPPRAAGRAVAQLRRRPRSADG